MNIVLTLIAIAVLALCVLVWLLSRLRGGAGVTDLKSPSAHSDQKSAQKATDALVQRHDQDRR